MRWRLKKVSDQINNDDSDFNVIGDVLETLRFRGSIFFSSELAAPWGMSLAQVGFPRFHVPLSGSFSIGTNNKDVINVQDMEIIMLPNGTSHWIADQPGRELIPSERAGRACELGRPLFQQGQITNRLMCGLVNYDLDTSHPILDAFPQVLHFTKLNSADPIWMSAMLIDAEMRRKHFSDTPIVDRLTEAFFLQLLERYVSENKETTGFLAALSDRRVHRALILIHQELNYNWTLSLLSERVGMSRATLNRHFQDTVGVAPMTYVMNWRITKAYNLIKYSDATLDQIAESIGFMSARTLNKAFQRHYNYTPNVLRQAQVRTETSLCK